MEVPVQNTYYVFRKPQSIEELRCLLELRYNTYQSCHMRGFTVPSQAGIDADCYDLRAMHFGMFEYANDVARPVGYIRLVTEEVGPNYYDVVSIAGGDSHLVSRV